MLGGKFCHPGKLLSSRQFLPKSPRAYFDTSETSRLSLKGWILGGIA